MPLNNGLTLASKNCDIEITNAAGDVYGFPALAVTIPEDRASKLAESTGETAPTIKSAGPFETMEITDWSYGYGQTSMDRVEGGVAGMGGNPAQYFYGDCFTLRPGKLLPGMARDMVYNTVGAAQMTPITDGLDPLGGDEYEVPRGVLPGGTGQTYGFSTTSTVTPLTGMRVLVYFSGASTGTVVINGRITGATVYDFQLSVDLATVGIYTGWKWITLPKTAGLAGLPARTGYVISVSVAAGNDIAVGCWVAAGNSIAPYFQLVVNSLPYKYWSAPPARMEQLNNAGAYENICITTLGILNADATSVGAGGGITPERGLGAAYCGSIVFKGNLYVSTSGTVQTLMFTPANLATNGAPTSTTTFMNMVAASAHGGLLYAVNFFGSGNNFYKWDGTFPVVNGSIAGGQNFETIINSAKIGDPATFVTNMVIFQGSMYVFKPEGLFKVVSALGDISTSKVPEVIQVWTAPVQLASNGKWACEHQGKLYFNFRNLVVELVMQEDKPTITRYNPSPPWYRLSYYSYINGLTSDGQTLYCSLNNFGISAYNGQGWHPIAEFYEQVAVEDQSSGLRWLPNPQGAPDYLYCGDGRTLLKIPIPNIDQPYTSQIYQNHQNKCGYFITPEWTGNLADMVKNMRSVILRATPNGWSYKLVAVVWQTGTSSSFKTLLEQTWREGLLRDSWTNPSTVFSNTDHPANVATTLLDSVAANPVANTLAPACWASSDFDNAAYQSQKLAVPTTNTTTTPPTTRTVTNPVKLVKTQFILYTWNPVAGQASTIRKEITSVDAVALKHLPKQKYVARYGVSLDLKALAEIGSVVKTVSQVNTSTKWLRDQAVAGDPLQFKFYDITGAIKTVNGIIQGFHGEAFKLDKGQTKVFPLMSQFSILSLDEEESIYG
jgi:hypothetical protein